MAKRVARKASKLDDATLEGYSCTASAVVAQRTGRDVRKTDGGGNGVLIEGETQASLHGTCARGYDVRAADRRAIMQMMSDNMQHLYTASKQGWNEQEKEAELFDPEARWILVHTVDSTLAAFVNWRFDVEACEDADPTARRNEDAVEVAYCYEVQVAAQHRQQRLGPVLMAMLESIAAHAGMRKVMLTVFRSNSSAMHFYIKNGYVIDGISPSQYQDAGGAGSSQGSADYEILSKAVGAWASGGT